MKNSKVKVVLIISLICFCVSSLLAQTYIPQTSGTNYILNSWDASVTISDPSSIIIRPHTYIATGASFYAHISGNGGTPGGGGPGDCIKCGDEPNNPFSNEMIISAISIYPNPTSGIITINAVNVDGIKIVNKLHQSVLYEVIESNRNKVKIRILDLSEDIYFIKINTNSGVLAKKIVIKK